VRCHSNPCLGGVVLAITLMRALQLLFAVLLGAATLMVGCQTKSAALASKDSASAESVLSAFSGLEREVGGRLGIFALDLESGRELAQRADERFALCSTFKWLLAANVLFQVDRGALALSDRVPFAASDILEYAPVVREHASEGMLSVGSLAEAAVTVSDNAAANLLLPKVGGPEGLTQFLRSLGDETTRLDRTEPSLNENLPGDLRDTTSPRAMGALMRRVLIGETLSADRRALLLSWLVASPTGQRRIRAGLAGDWKVGDKTGTCNQGTVNDVAIIWPPGRAPVLLAVYLSDARSDFERLEAAHARVAELVVLEFSR
jgi:beta-lactamase class A